jgi:hypothetical protein
MKRRALQHWFGLLTVVALATSCRSHLPLCQDECEAAPAAGAGAGPTDEMAAGEGGQAGAPPECVKSSECTNRLACDGEERCARGSCEPGQPVSCPHPGMRCDEEAGGDCVFDPPSPWLVVGQGETLGGLPTSQLGKEPLITLASRPPSRALGFVSASVGNNGSFALAVSHEEEFLRSTQYFRFEAGLPSELRPLPDVPDLIEALREPLVSPDSSFALIFDRATGIYLAPLADRSRPTVLFPLEPGVEHDAAFCEEPSTFWRYDGASVTLESAADALPSRPLGGSTTPKFSVEKRFVVLTIDDPPGVLVTPCSIEGANTVYEGAWGPIIAPGSTAVLVQLEAGQKLYSLEDPRVELWSSSVRLTDPSFSSDGSHLVGSVDEVLHVADLREPSGPPVSLGLPEGARLAEVWMDEGYLRFVGKRAALFWLPGEGGEVGTLFWQPLDPSRKRRALLSELALADLDFFLSGRDVDQIFVTVRRDDGQHLKRIRLDTVQAELEELFTLPAVTRLELAPDGSGLAVVGRPTSQVPSALYWAAIDRDGEVQQPVIVSQNSLNFAFQPWP